MLHKKELDILPIENSCFFSKLQSDPLLLILMLE